MNQYFITTNKSGGAVLSALVNARAPVRFLTAPIFNFFYIENNCSLKKPVSSLNRRFAGFNRVCPVHAGSHRFKCMTDPICQPNRLPLRFTVGPVRFTGLLKSVCKYNSFNALFFN